MPCEPRVVGIATGGETVSRSGVLGHHALQGEANDGPTHRRQQALRTRGRLDRDADERWRLGGTPKHANQSNGCDHATEQCGPPKGRHEYAPCSPSADFRDLAEIFIECSPGPSRARLSFVHSPPLSLCYRSLYVVAREFGLRHGVNLSVREV
jgi:hypothetical protein